MENLKTNINASKNLLDLFEKNRDLLDKNSGNILNSKRDVAIKKFLDCGLPGKQNEDYKYLDVEELFGFDYRLSLSPEKFDVDLAELFKCNLPELDSYLVLLVNGWYYHKNQAVTLPKGVICGSLNQVSKEHPEIIEKYYGKVSEKLGNGLEAVNTAFASDGLFLYVPQNIVVDKPIQVVNLSFSYLNLLVQQRNLVILEKNSQAKLVVCDHTLTPNKFLNNFLTEVYTEENANLEYVNVQDINNESAQISGLYVMQEKNSSFRSTTVTLHGGITRNNVRTSHLGENCDTQAYGIYLMDKKQHIDNFTFIEHGLPNCSSKQLFKGVLDDEATGAFNGKILVKTDAQNTNAYQANNNLLLTDQVRMNTRPQLEIYADDVKCSHGATVGQIDGDALFYLRARGISEKEARLMLMFAFAYEVIEKINLIPLRERISNLVEKRLRGELSRCNNCVINCS